MWEKFKEKYIAPSSFYQRLVRVALPIALQQLLNQGASYVDTIMVSNIGAVGAVAVAAQLDNLSGNVSYGINAGASMYGAQFYGADDYKSLKKIFGYQLLLNVSNALIFFILARFVGRQVLAFYNSDPDIIKAGWQYMNISCFSYVFIAITNTYSFMYRSIQKTQVPMLIGFLVTILNVIFNFLLIFGNAGFPAMGVQGAALATVISTTTGALCHIIYAYITKQSFIGSLREMTDWSISFLKPITKRMVPLICNETLFGFGNSMYIKAYGLLGTTALETYKIGNTISNFFYIGVQGLNSGTGLIIGEQLGKKDLKKAREYGSYLVLVAVILAVTLCGMLCLSAPALVSLFGLNDASRIEAAIMMVRLFSIRIAFRLFNVIIMGSLRSGGDTKFLMFLDCGIMWLVGIPLAFISVNVFHVSSVGLLFTIIQTEQLVRLIVGYTRYKQGKWIRNLTTETS